MTGLLLVDKPKGKTSFYLVGLLRKLFNIKKVGHAGTLDPFATGVMVMMIGKDYTRLSDQFLGQSKEYETEVLLGQSTDSYDCDGAITSESDYQPSLDEVNKVLSYFQGTIEQIPPMFSAKKIGGKKLYELARQGKTIERKPAIVTLETILVEYNYPLLKLKISCSKGTYIRSIAHDLGEMLKCGAHLVSLRRLKSGPFPIEQCITVEELLDPSFSINDLKLDDKLCLRKSTEL